MCWYTCVQLFMWTWRITTDHIEASVSYRSGRGGRLSCTESLAFAHVQLMWDYVRVGFAIKVSHVQMLAHQNFHEKRWGFHKHVYILIANVSKLLAIVSSTYCSCEYQAKLKTYFLFLLCEKGFKSNLLIQAIIEQFQLHEVLATRYYVIICFNYIDWYQQKSIYICPYINVEIL